MVKREVEMGEQIPQWLTAAIVSALEEAGATAPKTDLEQEARWLVRAWNVPERFAHNVKYLSTLFERLADFEGVTSNPATLKLAAAYLVTSTVTTWEAIGGWDPGRQQISAPIDERLEDLGVPKETASRVQKLVALLHTREVPTDDLEAQILFDAILEMLGTSPQRYARFREKLRKEAGATDEVRYLQARRRFIMAVLERSRIFLTPFATPWTESVRENLLGELSVINAKLGEEPTVPLAPRKTEATAEWEEEPAAPLVIRSAKTVPSTVTDQPIRRRKAAQKARKLEEEAPKQVDSHPDDTSTLEEFDDLFSHRRPRKE